MNGLQGKAGARSNHSHVQHSCALPHSGFPSMDERSRSRGTGISDSGEEEANDLIRVWSPARTQHIWVHCCKQEFSISDINPVCQRQLTEKYTDRFLDAVCGRTAIHHPHTQPHTLSRLLLLLSTVVLIQYLISFVFAAYVTITQDPKSSRSGLIIATGPLRINLSLKCLKSARGFRCACQWLGVIFGAHTLSKLLCSCDRARRASLNAKAEGKTTRSESWYPHTNALC